MRKNKALLKLLSNPVVIRRHYSPSIPRPIPATHSASHIFRLTEWVIVAIVSGILVVLIFSLSLQINEKVRVLSAQQAQKQSVIQEREYWENVIQEYPGYRDAYFRLAVLQYQLGEEDGALQSVNSAIALDPLFAEGITFRDRLLTE